MGGFAIVPKSSFPKKESVLKGFKKRGFSEPLKFELDNYSLFYFEKLSGIVQFRSTDTECLFVVGNLIYKKTSFDNYKDLLLSELQNNSHSKSEMAGTYTLVYANKSTGEIKVFHDGQAVNRFYIDKEFGIVSSSWLSLVWSHDKESRKLHQEAFLENMVLGFNIGVKTWVQGIERVKGSEQLPKSIEYFRYKDVEDKVTYTSKMNAISESIESFKSVLNENTKGFHKLKLGLSSGYDSRLLSSSFDSEGLDKVSFFTFHKPGDKDPAIAQKIAKTLDKELHVEKYLSSDSDIEDVFKRAFYFFDGQCVLMMQYSKEEYTANFRKSVFASDELHLSGVGGEIYRNYNHDHKKALNTNFWIDQYYNGGNLKDWIGNRLNILNSISKEIAAQLGLRKENRINYYKRKQFYANVFLSDWHGVRNTIENQYSYYYSPFTDVNLKKESLKTINWHGVGGEFEAEMIKESSIELAAIDSDYGHNFLSYPLKSTVKGALRQNAKKPLLSKLRKYGRGTKKVSSLSSSNTQLMFNLIDGVDFNQLEKNKPVLVETANYALSQLFQTNK